MVKLSLGMQTSNIKKRHTLVRTNHVTSQKVSDGSTISQSNVTKEERLKMWVLPFRRNPKNATLVVVAWLAIFLFTIHAALSPLRQLVIFDSPFDSKLSSKQLQQMQRVHVSRFGFVMRDFARRVLNRKICSSDVFVIAPDATAAAKAFDASGTGSSPLGLSNPYDTLDTKSPYSLASTFLLYAATEGHSIHAIDAGYFPTSASNGNATTDTAVPWQRSLNEWWSSFEDRSIAKSDRWWSSTPQQPKWIIATVLNLGFGYEDQIWSDADKFLTESTTTYIVFTIHARQVKQRDSSQTPFEFDGLQGAAVLLRQKYKLQILSSSHYHSKQGDEVDTEELYGPNRLFQSIDDIKDYLEWGARAAALYQDVYSSGKGSEGSIFTAQLFATQGLDLAIPSSRVHLDESSRVQRAHPTSQINLYKPLNFKACRKSLASWPIQLNVTFQKLRGEVMLRVDIENKTSTKKQSRVYSSKSPVLPGFSYVRLGEQSKTESKAGPQPNDVSVWYNSDKIETSEAACVRFGSSAKCTTQVIPQLDPQQDERHRTKMTSDHDKPNILLVMLDPMSRGHFQRTMPQTRSTLEELGFTYFKKYTAVGKNSGPNQAALYSGIPLANRDGIRSNLEQGFWLWDRLNAIGYKTLKTEDGCIENSNMIQSIKPNTTHGEALHKLFCFDFDRPNCIGPDLASSILLNYTDQFIKAYDGISPWAGFVHFIDSHEDAMVLSGILDPQLSEFITDTVNENRDVNNTIVIITSDHGLHYGPYFQSLAGRREATEPLLYVRVPRSLQSRYDMEALEKNADVWTTAFDVHETLLDFAISSVVAELPADEEHLSHNRAGLSLLSPLPATRHLCTSTDLIPKEYCDQYDRFKAGVQTGHQCKRMPAPPSPLSFFADIPLNRRSRQKRSCGEREKWPESKPGSGRDCRCATSHRTWRSCSEHPWGSEGMESKKFPEESFALMKCKKQEMVAHTRVVRQERLVQRYFNTTTGSRAGSDDMDSRTVSLRRTKEDSTAWTAPPNILFIEVDSASVAYADRHLPLTREFLRRHRMQRDDSSKNDIQCKDAICAAEFSLFSVVGPNSIANQVAALSGCVVSLFHNSCFGENVPLSHDMGCADEGMYTSANGNCQRCPTGTFLSDPLFPCGPSESSCCTAQLPDRNETRICRNESLLEHDLQLFRQGPRRHTTWCPAKSLQTKSGPFLFDIAKAAGYVTFFGEEICYDTSLFVTQGNVFPLDADHELHKLYCRLNENRRNVGGVRQGPQLCARQHTAHGETINPAFDHITSLWNAYPDIPKFAFMGALAAHDYSFSWSKMVSTTEDYDAHLVTFLEAMTMRDDFMNTIIVLRADHGLQGGPSTVEYVTQVEHRQPWTQIILPQNFSDISLGVLFENQDRLATGYDLYRMMHEVMEGQSGKTSKSEQESVSEWSYNLLHSSIPINRTCRDAKIPVDYCPCEGEGPDLVPTYGVCNLFEPYSDLYCVGGEEAILPDFLEI